MIDRLRPSLPLSIWPLGLLCAVYLLAGLLGHDPWKVDDAVHLGVAYEFAYHGDWLSPRIVGDAWLSMPPLFHWVAALFGRAFDFALAFPDGARLATALFGALLFLGLGLACRRLHGRDAALGAPLLALGTAGLLIPIHEAQPLIALLAAQAFLHYGLARMDGEALKGGLIAGIAMAVGLLSVGSLAVIPMVLPPLAALLHTAWRRRAGLGALLALVLGLALATLWPILLAWHEPEQFSLFLIIEKAKLTPLPWSAANFQDHLELMAWASWPVLPLALWATWKHRHNLRSSALFIPLIGTLLALVQVFALAEPRPLNHLLLVVPLTLLAAAGAEKLRRGAANAFDWFGMMTFTMIAGLIWLGGIAIMTGEPVRVARNFTKPEPGFVGEWSWLAVIAATVLTLLWLWSLWRLPKSPWRSSTHWAAGLTLMWSLLAFMWMPWLDYGKTYRPVADGIAQAMGDSNECVLARNLGDSQKASFRYFTGFAPLPYTSRNKECAWLLIQGQASNEYAPGGWRKVWEGGRPGDKNEKFRLYRRS
ncbi:MAG TPA: hypothetical protein VFW68_11730 [Rhodocyclaceae bacterium]|nr:hypothetical protein [Rhodocyclaceae bacterium]